MANQTLKATHIKGSMYYTSTGLQIFVYAITGASAAAIAAYKAAKSKATGKPEAELGTDEFGNQTFHLRMFPGTVATKTLQLQITEKGKVVVDRSDEDMAKSQRIANLSEMEEAKTIVGLKFGTIQRVARNPIVATASNDVAEPKDEFDTTLEELQAEPIGDTKELATAGTETLGG